MMYANTTMWSSYASFGSGWIFWPVILAVAIGILGLLLYSTHEWMAEP